jgi:hypothetical protein
VQTYREEGGMIKFFGMGGEIGIARDQVKTILKPGEKEERGMVVVPGVEGIRAAPAEAKPEEKEGVAPRAPAAPKPEEKAPSPEQKQAEERASEEKEYQTRIKQLTEQIQAARDRYAIATRGSSSAEPTLLNTEEAIRARSNDLSSRLRDAGLIPELRPGATTPGVEVQPPISSGKERELSELRNQINQLTKQRGTLIEEMRQKGFETGSLFLD